MSGTSLDGVDAALIETDGYDYAKPLAFYYRPYEETERAQIKSCFGRRDRNADDVWAAERLVTIKHAEAVLALLKQENMPPQSVDYIGFHGQTIFHAPAEKLTIQIGDGDLLAKQTGIAVIYDFRSHDVSMGGEGAPLAPIYHRALAKTAGISTPLVILNIGGVSNVTWIGTGVNDILAFDTGPGNALMDDWVQTRTGQRYDEDGKLAKAGTPIQNLLDKWSRHPYFTRQPPKSLDRNEWDIADLGEVSKELGDISTEDGAATLLQFTVQTILDSQRFMPEVPQVWYACGGGRHNKALMGLLSEKLNIHSIDELGWDGDAIEAECFAYLAIRNSLNLPISFPTTTGISEPLSGGKRARL